MENLQIESVLIKVKEMLTSEKVKLWLPPYYSEDTGGQSEEEIKAAEVLSSKYSAKLNIDKEVCLSAIRELQQHALEKLLERKKFQETGIAAINVKVCGDNVKMLSIGIELTKFISELQQAIGDKLNIRGDRIKLISNGKVLRNSELIMMEGVKNGSQIMAVVLQENASDIKEYESQAQLLEKTKDDVGLLTAESRRHDDDHLLQITDQSGNTLRLPAEEKKALATAMTLHEKGRTALNKEDYSLALVLLLEADKEFSSCTSQLLQSVDNFALLNLDIAWCYLCLQNLTQLPDAEKRLKVCESKFKYSYGPNLERVVALKGNAGNESALLMRLHLLQGIVLFHQNKMEAAYMLLQEAKKELFSLKIDENSMLTLLELGISPAEARLGLRATNGQLDAAIDFIHRRREERENISKREKEDRERRKLGLCQDGKQYVEPKVVDQLEDMGFARLLAVEALRRSNNCINEAIKLLHEQSSQLMFSEKGLLSNLIKQVVNAGFDPLMAKLALKRHDGNVEKAIEELISNSGFLDGEVSDEDQPSTSFKKERKRMKRESEAYKRIAEDLKSETDLVDNHLDITLEQEEQFLTKYLSLLN